MPPAHAIKPFALRKISDAIHDQADHAVVNDQGQVFVPIGKGGKAPENIEKRFKESEVTLVKNAAYQEGFNAGKDEGLKQGQGDRLEQDKQLEQSWQKAAIKLENISNDLDAFKQKTETFALNLAHDIAKTVLGEILEQDPAKHIDIITKKCSDVLLEQPKINICIHPDIEPYAKQKISEFETRLNLENRFSIKADSSLDIHDCTMNWEDGGSTNLMRQRWQEIRNILGEKNLFSSLDNQENLEENNQENIVQNQDNTESGTAHPVEDNQSIPESKIKNEKTSKLETLENQPSEQNSTSEPEKPLE